MFGYVTVQQPELKIREFETYRAYYCGLCRALRRRYGLAGQATLSYDMTFLAMLLGGLYEPESTEGTTLCLLHPGVKHPTVTDPYVEYAAHMNLLLSYYNLEDDWRDERKLGGKIGADLLRRKAEGLAEYYPRQAQAVKRVRRRSVGTGKGGRRIAGRRLRPHRADAGGDLYSEGGYLGSVSPEPGILPRQVHLSDGCLRRSGKRPGEGKL